MGAWDTPPTAKELEDAWSTPPTAAEIAGEASPPAIGMGDVQAAPSAQPGKQMGPIEAAGRSAWTKGATLRDLWRMFGPGALKIHAPPAPARNPDESDDAYAARSAHEGLRWMASPEGIEQAMSMAAFTVPGGKGSLETAPGEVVPAGSMRPPLLETTPAARYLETRGLSPTTGQRAPHSALGKLESAAADNFLGMRGEREAVKEAWRDVVRREPLKAGDTAPLPEGDAGAAMEDVYQRFGPDYDAIRSQPVTPESVAGMPDAARNLPGGVDARTRNAVAGEVENALTVLPERPKAGTAGADPLAAPSRTRTVAMPEEAGVKAAKIPDWLDPEDFLANREAWDWTWSATGGPEAPRAVQKLVFEHMKRAVGGAEDFAFGENAAGIDTHSLKRGYAAAKLAQGAGGQRFSGLRDAIADWAAQPEATRAADPIEALAGQTGKDPWGALVDTTRMEKVYGEGNRFGDVKKTDRMRTWLAETQAALNPDHPAHMSGPAWYGDFAPEAPPAAAPARLEYTAGDLMKVRQNLREQIRAARQSQDFDKLRLLEHAEDVVTGTLEQNLSSEAQAALRDADRRYAIYNVIEDATSRAGLEGNFSPKQLGASVRKAAGRRAFAHGGGGDLRELAEAGDQAFADVPMTGARIPIVSQGPGLKYTAGALTRLANTEAGRRFLFESRPRWLSGPGAGASSPATAVDSRTLLEWLRSRVRPTTAGAEEDQ